MMQWVRHWPHSRKVLYRYFIQVFIQVLSETKYVHVRFTRDPKAPQVKCV